MTELDMRALQQAINNGDMVSFDYVSKDFEVKRDKHVLPKEIKMPYLWAEDAGKIKRYLLDGIVELKIAVAVRKA